jgi:hypothetical protein
MTRDQERLLEQACGAYRPRAPDGTVLGSPAWHDLHPAGRRAAFETALVQRRLEAALDAEGLSTTARAVLERIGSYSPTRER